jgi:hypothetical protein
MPFPWSKKLNRVIPTAQPEVVQIIELPVVDDKISSIEHKNGERLADARKEDDETDEVQGDLQEGRRSQEGHHGGEEVMERCEDEESSSPRTSLKK